MSELLARLLFLSAAVASLIPCWWLAGRVVGKSSSGPFRLLVGLGLELIAFLSLTNLVGRWLESLFWPLACFSLLGLTLTILVLRSRRGELGMDGLLDAVGGYRLVLALALLLAIPQGLVSVSTNLWDEAVSSAIHLTGVNQISEDVYPPRHNALPQIAIKYHYGSIVLAGTAKWLTGLPTALAVDAVTIGLWLFVFLFVFFWLDDLDLDRFSAFWGSFAVLLGGGLSWIFLTRLENYGNFAKAPAAAELSHRYNEGLGWFQNLFVVSRHQNFHLRNADGSYSLVPLDVANFLQQHPVPLGIALSLFGFYLFERWVRRKEFDLTLLFACILCFGLLFLGHAVYAAVACLSTGLFLLGRWLYYRSWRTLHEGILFTVGVTVVAHLHGGLLAVGPEYGAGGLARFRSALGYAEGGLRGFLEWNIAGFGLPLLLAVTGIVWILGWNGGSSRQKTVVALVALFAAISYTVPQLIFYTSSTSQEEQFTEVAKFFFCTQTGLGVLSAFGMLFLQRYLRRAVLAPAFVLISVTPLGFCYANAFYTDGQWNGLYLTPYSTELAEVGRTLERSKRGNRESFFDASRYERTSGFLSELLLHGGSVFTMTPSRYERTGNGYRLAATPVAERLKQNSRLARLLPGAAEDTDCRWFYLRPGQDLAALPLVVRSRFAKAVEEGVLVLRAEGSGRRLYSIDSTTEELDSALELHWRPRVVAPASTDWDGDGINDLILFDHRERVVRIGARRIPLPEWLSDSEMPMPFVGRFPGDERVDLLFGRMADTVYDPGQGQGQLTEYNGWHWSYLDSRQPASWGSEYRRWLWSMDIPLMADTDGDGYDNHLIYRASKREWYVAPNGVLEGPVMDASMAALPFAGNFLDEGGLDLGLWSPTTGQLKLRGATGTAIEFRWGGEAGDVLVPGDYDGDGLDELALWRGRTGTWFFRRAAGGSVRSATFGPPSGVPLPADYNGDGVVDLAVWEPSENRIAVSLDGGESVGLVLTVPPNTIPLIANMR